VALYLVGYSLWSIYKIIGSKAYWDGINIILWVVFATFLNFTYTLYVNIEFFFRKTALISSGTILAAITNIALNFLFLRTYGYHFAAISTVISYAALLIFHAIIVNHVLNIKMVDNIFVFTVVAVVFTITCVMQLLLNSLLYRILLGVICEAFLGITILMMYKKYNKDMV
jgi:O-antigen/teichoic acid export membrane protein